MTAAIHQPDYIPYPGYFFKISHSDIFIFLDDAQFSNRGGHDLNRIKSPAGPVRLKVPVRQTLGDRILDVRTRDDLGWKERHLKTLRMNYAHAPYFREVYSVFEKLLAPAYPNLAEMNMAIILEFARLAGIGGRFLRSSALGVPGIREERVIALCRVVGADCYLSGTGARAYQVPGHFAQAGVRLLYSDYRAVPYTQQWGDFLPDLSALDGIFNCGFGFLNRGAHT